MISFFFKALDSFTSSNDFNTTRYVLLERSQNKNVYRSVHKVQDANTCLYSLSVALYLKSTRQGFNIFRTFGSTEIPAVRSACSTGTANRSDLSTALIAYAPTPVLKLSAMDIAHLRYRQDIPDVIPQLTATLVVVLMALAQHRKALLLALEKLKHDTPLPWIEHYEPEASPWPAWLRSMSGSTVAEASSREVLSFSAVSTVCDSSAVEIEIRREVRWVEERDSEEKDTGKEVKRPKLNEYKQVSSGRVATLMDRFERFHI